MVDLKALGESELNRLKTAPEEFFSKLDKVSSKRGRFVVEQILEHGYCTTKTIQEAGYEHPPRAARDVKESGIELLTKRYQDHDGRRLGAYVFGDYYKDPLASKASGRTVLSNTLKQELINLYGSRCFIFLEELPAGQLQIDHRVPYEIGGEQDTSNPDNFMLLSASANRRKSWTCEHCKNWTVKNIETCQSCFWAHPENYLHVACNETREVSFTLNEKDAIEAFDKAVSSRGLSSLMNELRDLVQRYLLD
jgi:hypothetical protein